MTDRACTTCRFHRAEPVCGGVLHLCTVRHALPDEPDENETPFDRDEREAAFLGWDCDRTRRMGELCGPTGAMWSPKP